MRQPTNTMKIPNIAKSCLAAFACGMMSLAAQEIPEMPKPLKEHQWLQKFTGDWETTSEMQMEPGKPAIKGTGKETAKMLGGFWVTSHGTGEIMGTTMNYVMTLGYDAEKKKFVGTMIDSMTSKMWKYEGTVSEDGNTLTLETEGPCPMRGGMMTEFKDITQFTGDGTRTFSSMFKDEDGKWVTIFKGEAKRK